MPRRGDRAPNCARPGDAPAGARARSLDEFAPPKPKRPKKPPSVPRARREALARELEEMREAGEWGDFAPGHAVALWAACHQRVYGAAPAEADDAREYAQATFAARRLMQREFGGAPGALLDFMRWAWHREQGRERWRRQHGKEGGRLGWRLQFGAAMVSDYRLDAERKR